MKLMLFNFNIKKLNEMFVLSFTLHIEQFFLSLDEDVFTDEQKQLTDPAIKSSIFLGCKSVIIGCKFFQPPDHRAGFLLWRNP